jgi:uncharacterized protein (TIGR03435 family)
MKSRSMMALILTAIMTMTPRVPAQAPGGANSPAYDVVSVKENNSGTLSQSFHPSIDGLAMTNVTLKQIILLAFTPQSPNFIVGLPKWADTARFDINAKIDPDKVATLRQMPRNEVNEQRKLMIQAILTSRFNLKVHHEEREFPAYALTVAKDGLKLREADANQPKSPSSDYHPGMATVYPDGRLKGQAISMDQFVRLISGSLDRQAVDKTGLTGKYDITLQWLPDNPPPDHSGQDGQAAKASIYTALQEQLGLRLEPTKASFDTVVVDHIDMPTEN